MQIAERQLDVADQLHEQLQATNRPWITEAYAWVRKVPDVLRGTLTSWITFITAMCGVGTIGFSKLKRGESGVAAALTSALLAGILAFTISWAWQPIANLTERAGHQDLELLTDYVFLHPDDRGLVEEILFERYPGLPNVDAWRRSELLAAKVSSDQASSIPGGIWIGLIVTVFITALPLFVSSVLASVIWRRDHRGWGVYWRSLEVAFYATTLIFLLGRSLNDLTGPPPLMRYQLVSLVVMVAAIVIALRRKPAWWRVPAFLVVFFTTIASLSDSSTVERSHWHAQGAETDADLAEVVPFLARKVAITDDRERRFQLATVYAYLGDLDNYKAECDVLLASGNYYQRKIAEQTAKVVLLMPGVHDDLSKAHRLARWTSEQRAYNAWDYLCRSLSEYRRGDHKETSIWTQRCREPAVNQRAWQKDLVQATAYMLDALVHQKNGESADAQESLRLADGLYDPDSEASFEAKLTYRLLLGEFDLPSE